MTFPRTNRHLANTPLPADFDTSRYPLNLGFRTPEYRQFVERLKRARLAAGIGHREAAARLGWPQWIVARCEHGDRRIDPRELAALIDLYGDDLTSDEDLEPLPFPARACAKDPAALRIEPRKPPAEPGRAPRVLSGRESPLERVFDGRAVMWFRSGPLGPHLDALTESLVKQRYRELTLRRYVRVADAYGRWLLAQGLGIDAINEATAAEYIDSVRGHGGRWREARNCIATLTEMLRLLGVVAPGLVHVSDADRFLASYHRYLENVRGVGVRARYNYVRNARLLIEHRFGADPPRWTELTAEDVRGFVTKVAFRLSPISRHNVVTATKMLLRFLTIGGAVHPGLIGAVPHHRTWRLGTLPKYLEPADVAKVLEACDDGTDSARRDKTMLLLMARLGLRGGEVAGLQLDDIDWVDGRVLIRGKTGERSLPLPQDVGDAFAAYIREARPKRSDPGIFLTTLAPIVRMKGGSVSGIARKRMQMAGVSVRGRQGAHILRHSAATQMIRQGATFKEVADVLGHRSLRTTEIYAKVDVGSLARVAMKWPEPTR